MLRKLIPVLVGLLALVGGGAAGWVLRPAPSPDASSDPAAHEVAADDHGATAEPAPKDDHAAPAADDHGAAPPAPDHGDDHGDTPAPGGKEYVKLNNQFVVPLIDGGRVVSMVILSLSLEVQAGSKDHVYAVEPKLRDIYLRVMFDHANAGGFAGTFTDRGKMDVLRATLAEVSRPLLGDSLSEVLIEDIVRQDNG